MLDSIAQSVTALRCEGSHIKHYTGWEDYQGILENVLKLPCFIPGNDFIVFILTCIFIIKKWNATYKAIQNTVY